MRFSRTLFRKLLLFLVFTYASVALALHLDIVSLRSDGLLTWTNDQTNIYCGIQYTTSLNSSWLAAPPPLWNFLSTTYTNTLALPFSDIQSSEPQFYLRLAGSTNVLPGPQAYDVDSNGIPILVEADYIELSKISQISRFRSGEGHDYSDAYESCRSMKHYFTVDPLTNATSVKIFSPITGFIYDERPDSTGTQVWITSTNNPAFFFILFHVNLTNGLVVGTPVSAGQQLGTHTAIPSSDIAVKVYTPGGEKLLSYFDLMPDSLFHAYEARGVSNRAALIITKEERDADPLGCNGETFTYSGSIPNDVNLSP